MPVTTRRVPLEDPPLTPEQEKLLEALITHMISVEVLSPFISALVDLGATILLLVQEWWESLPPTVQEVILAAHEEHRARKKAGGADVVVKADDVAQGTDPDDDIEELDFSRWDPANFGARD